MKGKNSNKKISKKTPVKVKEKKSGSSFVSPYKKIKLGIPGFDILLAEGIPEGASVLVEGGPGSGKTIFCLNALYNKAKEGHKVLYMSFEEPEERLIDHMKSFGWDVDTLIKKGLLRIKRFDALDIARSVEALLSAAKKELLIDVEPMFFPEDFDPEFVMVDSLTSISSAFSGEESRFRIYMEQLFRYLETKEITSFLIREVPIPTHTGRSTMGKAGEAVSFLSDGIIAIYSVIHDSGRRGSALEIVKMRGEKIDKKIVTMTISNTGMTVYPNKVVDGIHTKLKLT